MITFELIHPRATIEHLGIIPDFFSEADPRSAAEQLNENYAHGGGFREFGAGKFKLRANSLHYPGDEPFQLIAKAKLHDETLLFFESAILVIQQPNGTFKVTRVD